MGIVCNGSWASRIILRINAYAETAVFRTDFPLFESAVRIHKQVIICCESIPFSERIWRIDLPAKINDIGIAI